MSKRSPCRYTRQLALPVKLNGYHDVTAKLESGGKTWVEKRSFVRLAPDTRAVRFPRGGSRRGGRAFCGRVASRGAPA